MLISSAQDFLSQSLKSRVSCSHHSEQLSSAIPMRPPDTQIKQRTEHALENRAAPKESRYALSEAAIERHNDQAPRFPAFIAFAQPSTYELGARSVNSVNDLSYPAYFRV